jgi:hypothetical protein
LESCSGSDQTCIASSHLLRQPDLKRLGSFFVSTAGRCPTAISPEKVRPICVVTSFFAGIPALLARNAAGFGLQTAPVALLSEALARWPPWSSPSKGRHCGQRWRHGSAQPWHVILVLGSLLLPQKSTLCFQTEDRVRIFPRGGNAPWQQCPKIGEVPVKARRRAMLPVNL